MDVSTQTASMEGSSAAMTPDQSSDYIKEEMSNDSPSSSEEPMWIGAPSSATTVTAATNLAADLL